MIFLNSTIYESPSEQAVKPAVWAFLRFGVMDWIPAPKLPVSSLEPVPGSLSTPPIIKLPAALAGFFVVPEMDQ